MTFGTADRRKADVAEGVALAIGHVATRRGNRLGVVTFGDVEPRTLPPRQGRAGLLGLLPALRRRAATEPAGTTSFVEALRRIGRRSHAARARRRRLRLPRPADWQRPLLELAGRHDVVAIEIRDPREQELPNVGELWLVDPETGRQASRRHPQRAAPPALRDGGGRRARRARTLPSSARRPPRRPLHRRATGSACSCRSSAGRERGGDLRVAARARRPRARAARRRRLPADRPAAREPARRGSRRPRCSRTSSPGRPAGCATCPSRSCWSR